MKRLFIIAILAVSAMGIALPALAQTKVSINSHNAREVREISPYDLVTASYQGRFTDYGIPAAGGFVAAVRADKIEAEDLVEVAIAQRRLSSEALNDRAYLSHVRSMMKHLDTN